jgi:hypothetical protein
MGMLADDDGFVNAPRSIMRQCGASMDDMRVLLAKKFVIEFESGVIVIKHWRINNYLQADRTQPTKYIKEKEQLTVGENRAYHLIKDECIHSSVYTDKNSIEENSIDKNSKSRFAPPTVEQVKAYCLERGNSVDAETFVDFYTAKGWKVGRDTMKDWKACVRTWEKRDNKPKGLAATSSDYTTLTAEQRKKLLKGGR